MHTVEQIDPKSGLKEKDYDELAIEFLGVYGEDPWNEYMRCPKCFDPENSDPIGFHGKSDSFVCQECKNPLEIYWTSYRVSQYLEQARKRSGFLGLILRENGKIIGWVWGYDASDPSIIAAVGTKRPFQVDVIGVASRLRGKKRGVKRLTKTVAMWWIRRIPSKGVPGYSLLLRLGVLPPIGELGVPLCNEVRRRNHESLVTRTHKTSPPIQRLLRGIGFVEVGITDKNDPGREYLAMHFN